MNDKQIDELIDRALRDEQALPEGLSERLERFVDTLAEEETAAAESRPRRRRLGWVAGAAAAAAILAAVFVIRPETPAPDTPLADTYTDPAEAAVAVEQAFHLLSVNFNKGLDQVAHAAAEMERANELLLKIIQKEQP